MCGKITSHWQPLFSKKMEAAASFSYKIGGGGKDLATLLAAVLTWSGYWVVIQSYEFRLLNTMPLNINLKLLIRAQHK